MFEAIKYSLRHCIYKNYLDTYIVATVRTSDLIISCDSCRFKGTHIHQIEIFLNLRTVANTGKELESSRKVIAMHCVLCR
jgi:hypothetical protein